LGIVQRTAGSHLYLTALTLTYPPANESVPTVGPALRLRVSAEWARLALGVACVSAGRRSSLAGCGVARATIAGRRSLLQRQRARQDQETVGRSFDVAQFPGIWEQR
jgi:hypothetical protein